MGSNTGPLTDSGESVMRIGGITGQLTDSGESVMRIGGNTGQLTDSGKSVMRIGGNTGQSIDSGESVHLWYNCRALAVTAIAVHRAIATAIVRRLDYG